MYNLLRSDAYRLLRSRAVWAAGACLVLLGGIEGALYALQAAGAPVAPFGLFTVGASVGAPAGPMALTRAWGQALFSGGVLPCACALAASALSSQDFACGFERVLLSEGTTLRSYLGEKLVACAALCAVALLASVGSYQVAAGACGCPPQAEAAEPVLAWLLLAWLHLVAYGSLSVVVTWALHHRSGGLACAALLGSGVVGMCLWAALGALAPAVPLAGTLAAWLPYGNAQLLGQGAAAIGGASLAHVLAVEVVVLAAAAACAALLGRRGLRWW